MPTSLAALVGGAVSWPSGPSNASLKRLTNLSPEDIHVLLVDDERLSRVVVGNLLRKCNYRGNHRLLITVSCALSIYDVVANSLLVAELSNSGFGSLQSLLPEVGWRHWKYCAIAILGPFS